VDVLHRPGGPKPQAEIQRAYRARKAAQAADAAAARADLGTFVEMRDKLHNALLNLELREQDVARLEAAPPRRASRRLGVVTRGQPAPPYWTSRAPAATIALRSINPTQRTVW
jgi:hypothetical protein